MQTKFALKSQKNKFGVLGDYTCCTFSTLGTGSFKPNKNAHPFLGENGKTIFVDEVKIEFLCRVADVKRAISAIKQVHPYEQPAIDIVPLLVESDFFDKPKT